MNRLLSLGKLLRWGYLLPRLALLVALLCVSEIGAGWLVERAVRAGGEAAIGARIDVAKSQASLLSTRVSLRGLQVADPRAPMTNLVEAETIELDLDAASLLRKRAVVTRGVVRGLEFGTPRVTSGELPESPPPASSPATAWLTDAASERAGQWLDGLGDRFGADIQNNFESPRVARGLREKWPAKYDQLAASAKQVKSDAEALRSDIAEARRNPLRNADVLREAPGRVTQLQRQSAQLVTEFKSLPAQVQADRQAVAAARKRDEQRLREALRVERLEPSALSAYLLGDEIAGPMNELVSWLRWARQMAPAKRVERPEAQRGRGVDVQFAGLRRRPDLLIQALDLSGWARIGGRPVELTGLVTGATTQPERLAEPLRLELAATGALPVKLQATIDRTGPIARDALVASCQGLVLPETKLGGGKWLALNLGPSPASLSLNLALTGDDLSGEVRLVQHEVRISETSPVDPSSPVAPFRSALASRLSALPLIATKVSLAGTLDEPRLGLTSDLGPAVAQAMDTAIEQTINTQTTRLLAASEREVDAQLAKLDQELAAARGKAESLLAGPAEAIEQVAAELTGGNPFKYLGRAGDGLRLR